MKPSSLVSLTIIMGVISSNTSDGAGVPTTFKKGQVIGKWFVDKKILNLPQDGNPVETSSGSSADVVKKIRQTILGLKSDHTSEDGLSVNYEAICKAEEFNSYKQLVTELHNIKLDTLNESEKKSFLINIYNSLVIHAIITGLLDGFPGGTINRLRMYASASYIIGNIPYSLNDIENGLLRGNKLPPVPFTRPPFPPNDERCTHILPCDARIHFALNCGAASCPPYAVYSCESTQLESQLNLATRGFLDQSVLFVVEKKEVMLSMIFQWYREDFGTNDEEVLLWIKSHSSPSLSLSLSLSPELMIFSLFSYSLYS